eukprot:4328006-Pyramimonas_sp.AAC.1
MAGGARHAPRFLFCVAAPMQEHVHISGARAAPLPLPRRALAVAGRHCVEGAPCLVRRRIPL